MAPTLDERRELVERIARRILASMRADLDFLKRHGYGVAVFAFDLGENGALAYISTVEREGVLGAMKEWVAYQEAGLATEPRGERANT